MTRIPPQNPIEYLLDRKFPYYRKLRLPLPVGGRAPVEDRQRLLQEVREFRRTLEAKSPDELREMVEAERTKERLALLARTEREEQERFFNQPHAQADFVHWSKAIYWTIDEAVALSFGRAPEVVKWKSVEPYQNASPFARQYARARDLAIRAVNWRQLFEPVMPGVFLAWARRNEISVPEKLVQAVEARGIVIADWKDLYDKLKQNYESVIEGRNAAVARYERVSKERDVLSARVSELEDAERTWQFDEGAENYPKELDIAMQTWRAVANDRDSSMAIKKQIVAWLNKHYPELSKDACERIATVSNWEKQGGRPTGK